MLNPTLMCKQPAPSNPQHGNTTSVAQGNRGFCKAAPTVTNTPRNYQTTWTCYKDTDVHHVPSNNILSSPGRHMPVLFKQQQHITVVTRKNLDLGIKHFQMTEKPQHSNSLGCQKPEISQIKGQICEIIFWSRWIGCIPF